MIHSFGKQQTIKSLLNITTPIKTKNFVSIDFRASNLENHYGSEIHEGNVSHQNISHPAFKSDFDQLSNSQSM